MKFGCWVSSQSWILPSTFLSTESDVRWIFMGTARFGISLEQQYNAKTDDEGLSTTKLQFSENALSKFEVKVGIIQQAREKQLNTAKFSVILNFLDYGSFILKALHVKRVTNVKPIVCKPPTSQLQPVILHTCTFVLPHVCFELQTCQQMFELDLSGLASDESALKLVVDLVKQAVYHEESLQDRSQVSKAPITELNSWLISCNALSAAAMAAAALFVEDQQSGFLLLGKVAETAYEADAEWTKLASWSQR